VAEDGTRSAGEDGRRRPVDRGRAPVADRVDAWIDAVQTTGFEAATDGFVIDAELEELATGDMTVLARRDLGDALISGI
jgi:hypothetical protein